MSSSSPCPDDPDSEERHRLAFEVTGEGFWDWNRVADRWTFSSGMLTMVGRAPDELTPSLDNLTSLLHPEDREPTLDQLRRCAEGGCPSFQRELRLHHQNGEWLWTRLRCQALGKGPTGEAARLIGVHSDISDRQRAEEAYQASEARYRMLVENQGEGIGIVDAKEVFTTVNPAAEWIFGLEPGTMVGKSLADFVDPKQLERIADQTERRRQGNRDTYEIEFRRADGDLRIMLVTATPRYDEAGGYQGAFGVFRDITDRKRMEDKLREEEERYRQLVESLPHGVALLQRDRIVFANHTAVEMLGCAQFDELAAKPPIELLVPADRERVMRLLAGLRGGEPGGAVHYQTTAQTVSGKEIPVEAFVTSLVHRGERALQLVMMDISERLEAESHRVHLEDQLRQAQRLESIGRLAGGIAHDFNNLLSPIMLYSDLALQDLEPGDTYQEDFEQIRQAVRQARRLTQQLLAFGRRQVLKMKVLNINDVVFEAHRLIRRLIREDIDIQLELAAKVGNVKADPSQLHQVVLNLAINARDAMTEGGTMTIRSRDVELDETTCAELTDLEPGTYVSLEVADTGRGMTPETAAQIFEPFFTTKETGKGTGLGLATVHGIVMQHGGHIDVTTEPGKGTTFKILLPRVHDATKRSWHPSPLTRPLALEATVLVAEDDDQVRAQVERILRELGLSVIAAVDGVDALEKAKQHQGPIDLLLTDVIMPRMNGRLLYETLHESRRDLQVVFMSGYTDDVIADQKVIEEDQRFLQKPFSMRALSDAIRGALQR